MMDKISSIKENILQFIKNQKIPKEVFYKETEISASNFKGNGLKSEIGGDKIVKILTVYPEINPEWLLLGIGEMLRSEEGVFKQQQEDILINDQYKELLAAKEETIAGLRQNIKDKEEINSLLKDKIDRGSSVPRGAMEFPNEPKLGEGIGK